MGSRLILLNVACVRCGKNNAIVEVNVIQEQNRDTLSKGDVLCEDGQQYRWVVGVVRCAHCSKEYPACEFCGAAGRVVPFEQKIRVYINEDGTIAGDYDYINSNGG